MRQKTNPRPRKRSRSFTAPFLLFLIAVFGGAMWLRSEIYTATGHGAATKIITIEPGANTSTIIERLHDEGVLRHELPVRLWLRLFPNKRRFRAGDYEFKSPISPQEVINQLVRGIVVTRQFTIPEGYNQFDIARVLAGLNLKEPPPAKPEDLAPLFKNASLINDLDPKATTLEGYLFPDTYDFTLSAKRSQLVEAMVKRFRGVYTPEMQARADELKMNTRQVVTLASLIEKEAKV